MARGDREPVEIRRDEGFGERDGGIESGRGRERVAGLLQFRRAAVYRGRVDQQVQEPMREVCELCPRHEGNFRVRGEFRSWRDTSEWDATARRGIEGKGSTLAEDGELYGSDAFGCRRCLAFAEGFVEETRSLHPCIVPRGSAAGED